MPTAMVGKRCPAGNVRVKGSRTCLKKCDSGFSRKQGSFACTKKRSRAARKSPARKSPRARRSPKLLIHELD